MSVKLESLIEKIKADGIEAAKKEADGIVAGAKKEADNIVKEAQKQAEAYQKDAEAKAGDYQKNAEKAIQQAGRDTVLALKEKITAMFEQVLLEDVDKAMGEDFLKELIGRFAETWAKDEDIEVLVNNVDDKKLEAQLKRSLSKNVKGSVEIKMDKKIRYGFRVGKKGESLYYDFTDESILDAMRVFLNPKLAELLK